MTTIPRSRSQRLRDPSRCVLSPTKGTGGVPAVQKCGGPVARTEHGLMCAIHHARLELIATHAMTHLRAHRLRGRAA